MTMVAFHLVNYYGLVPMDDALVKGETFKGRGTTDINGNITLEVPPTVQRIYVSHKNFRDSIRIVDIADAEAQTIQVIMYPLSMKYANEH